MVVRRLMPVLVLLSLGALPASAHAGHYDFSVSPDPPPVGQEVTFSLVGPAEDVERVRWEFGFDPADEDDYEDASGLSVQYVFASSEPVQIGMRVTYDGNEREFVTRTISPRASPNAAPSADFSFSPAGPLAGQPVSFTGTASDPDGDPLSFAWNFGDGATASGPTAQHTYATEGSYTVTFTATDGQLASPPAFRTVIVRAPPAVPLPVRMRPFPVVRIAGVVLPRGADVRILSVRAARGVRIRVRCSGRGCPTRSVARTSATRLVRFPAFERTLRAGTTLELFVREAGKIGKYTRFVIRAGRAPARVDRCLVPGRARPVRCP